MPNKLERFSQRARRVLSLAQSTATQMRHNTIGTEHLLLGLLLEENGVAQRVLSNLNVQPQQVEALVAQLPQAETGQVDTMMDLSADTKRVLELAVDEARRMEDHYIGTEHLLLGLMRQPDCAAVKLLQRLNIQPDAVRQQIQQVLEDRPAPAAAPSPANVVRMGSTFFASLSGASAAAATLEAEVYAILPADESFQPLYQQHMQPIVSDLGLRIKRATGFFTDTDHQFRDILSSIHGARLVIVDCTGKDADVFYELGIAHTLGKPVIALAQSEADLAHMVRGTHSIIYENTPEGLQLLNDALRAAIGRIAAENV